MKLIRWTVLATFAVSAGLASLTSEALSHGGGYPPPPPPGGGGGGGGPPPPPPPSGGGGGGSGGGSSGPSSPGPIGPRAPSSPSGPQAPSSPRPRGPAAPAPSGAAPIPASAPSSPKGSSLPDISDWTWWWSYNRDPYLDLKLKVLDLGSLTGDDEFNLGQGQSVTRTSLLPDDKMKLELIGPALQAAIETGSWRMKSDGMLAIAKLHPLFEPEGKSMLDLLTANLSAANQKHSESAVVALGVMGDLAAMEVLLDIASDTEAGRKWVNRSSVPERTRPLAALSLGVLGRQLESEFHKLHLVRGLQAILQQPRGAAVDLHVACATAIGMTKLAERGDVAELDSGGGGTPLMNRASQVRYLISILLDEERHQYIRAHIPRAIALLVEDASLELEDRTKASLLREFERRGRSERLVSYGIVEALGMLGDADAEGVDADLREALHESVRSSNNEQRGISLVALALASSRPGESEAPLAALAGERKYLLGQLARGKSRARPWAALSLGLQQHHAMSVGEPLSKEVVSALLSSYEKTRAPRDAGAWSIALGLCRDPRAEEALTERLTTTGDDDLRGYAAVGLGLLPSFGSGELLDSVVEESRYRPIPLRKASIALVLLGRKGTVELLLKIIGEEKTASVKTSCIAALGLVGDRRAVGPLVELLEDTEQLDRTRSFACIALGVTCEEDRLPWTAGLANHVNYFAMTETLMGNSGTGILNLR